MEAKSILIIGYYFKNNLGDDIFEKVFKEIIFPNDSITFATINTLDAIIGCNFDTVILGGGDLVNNYFLSQTNITKIRQIAKDAPIVFVGTGIPYLECTDRLAFADAFYMRSKNDVKALSNFDNVNLIPDLAFYLGNVENPNVKVPFGPKKIGICLPYNYQGNSGFYESVRELLGQLVSNQVNQVIIIPFDTNNARNDATWLPPVPGVTVSEPKTIQETIDLFYTLDFVFASRFHSVILSIMTATPFISLYTTQKIQNLKDSVPTEFKEQFVKLNSDEKDKPLEFNVSRVMSLYESVSGSTGVVNKDHFTKDLLEPSVLREKILCTTKRLSPPQLLTEQTESEIIKKVLMSVLSKISISGLVSIKDLNAVLNGAPLMRVLPRHYNSNVDRYKTFITHEVMYTITGDPSGPYFYGLYDNILKNNFIEQVTWVVRDFYANYYYAISGLGPITIINKNFQRLHRSGWQYIVNNLVIKLNENEHSKPLIIDTYLDKTFHWNKSFYEKKGIIPYTKDWVGFIHHTFSDYNNEYNCTELFKDTLFLQSLQYCKCLIVMSSYLKKQIDEALLACGISVSVKNISHPTEYTSLLFDWDLFECNENKQVVQIGGWLRNVFSIYELQLPKNSQFTKSILKNKNSDSYFPPADLATRVAALALDTPSAIVQPEICRSNSSNYHIKGLIECIQRMESSVHVLEFLENDKYDVLLSKNIVFLNLVDASACNTIIECIMRNVPIIVNKIDPVVELLGEDYPLYYTNLSEATVFLSDIQLLKKAHIYLCDLDKTAFYIDDFLLQMTAILNNLH